MKYLLLVLFVGAIVFGGCTGGINPKYLQDRTYCEQDSDCVFEHNCCWLSPVNKYYDYEKPDCTLLDCKPMAPLNGDPFAECVNNECKISFKNAVITDFESCVAVVTPEMNSYPRQCTYEGETYTEKVDVPEDCKSFFDGCNRCSVQNGELMACTEMACMRYESPQCLEFYEKTFCFDEMRGIACTKEYVPVCGTVQAECITEPCPPVEETFSNGCVACGNERVEYYVEGECS